MFNTFEIYLVEDLATSNMILLNAATEVSRSPIKKYLNTPRITTFIREINSNATVTPKAIRDSTCEDSAKINDTPIRLTPKERVNLHTKILDQKLESTVCTFDTAISSLTDCIFELHLPRPIAHRLCLTL